MTKKLRNYRVLVLKRNSKGFRQVSVRGRKRFTSLEAKALVAKLEKRGRTAKLQRIMTRKTNNQKIIDKWLRGDLDFDRDLMVRLARVAKESKRVFYVNFGKRTRAEQQRLYDLYLAGKGNLAAKPGTSRHETGLAADVVFLLSRASIGKSKKVRELLEKHGLCLPVPGEPWHVERKR